MANNIKIIGNVNNTSRISRIGDEDLNLLSPEIKNQYFGFENDYIELFIYDTSNNLLVSNYNYKNFKLPANYGLDTNNTLPIIEIDPIQDLQNLGYISGEFLTQYHFQKRYISDPDSAELFISEISLDRTEIRLNSISLTSDDLQTYAEKLIQDIETSVDTKYYLFNLSQNNQFLIINAAIDNESITPTLLLKLYSPVSDSIQIKEGGWITEEIIEPYVFDINLDASVIPALPPQLKGPNFDIDIDIKQNVGTKYENYNSLISSLTGSSYHKVLNYVNNNSYDLNIDYTSFSNFIHFSSAKKRLDIFYNKVKQIEDYNTNISIISGSTSVLKNEETASIRLKIDDIVTNFDGFESYMYFESSSYAWPKTSIIKPYTLATTSSANIWYNSYTSSAINYDDENLDRLYNIIPNYIKNDPTNYQLYYDFIDMIGHYFDNIWIYIDSINELYNADNNLEKGVSKDIVYDALRSLGVKLYNSKGNNEFNDYVGGLNSGSTLFIDDFSATSSYLNNIPKKDQLAELYKRIYHNIPLLSKTKGTKSGLQNLITTFGITSSIFEPKEFGGSNSYNQLKGYDNDKITIQNNNITGSVLSPFISVQQLTTSSKEFTSTDLHFVDLSFSPQTQLDSRISSSIALLNPTFSLDQYIGDPRSMESSSYDDLIIQQNYFISASSAISGSAQKLDYKGFFELVKYFDNSLFKMLQDFVPARANTLTGITIKSPVLERNKIAVFQPDVVEQDVHEANYNSPVVSEDRDYHYDSIIGNKSSFYTGELTGSYINVNNVFEISNPNPYLHPSRSIDINKYKHSDFNVYLNNISSSVKSTSRQKFEPLYTVLNSIVYSQTGSLSEYTSSAELQDSYEELLGHQNSRYDGTKIYSLKYNSYSTSSLAYSGDKSFGKNSVIDYNTNKLGLFTAIKEDIFFKTNKNNVYLKYLVDKNGNLTELNKYNKHWIELQNIFKSGNNLTVAQFDTQFNDNQKSTDGVKLIYNSGYSYDPILYITGSATATKLYFKYSGEDKAKLFKANNITNGFISGSGNGNEKYPLKASGSVRDGYVIYNIFDNIIINDNSFYSAGTSASIGGVNPTSNSFPSYSVPADGNYNFNTSLGINVKFQQTNQSCSFKYDIIKGLIDPSTGFPTGSNGSSGIISTSGIKSFQSSFIADIYATGDSLNSEGAEILYDGGTLTDIPIGSSKLNLSNGLVLTHDINPGSATYTDQNGTTWKSLIVYWTSGGPVRQSLIFSKESRSRFIFFNDDLITTVENASGIQQNKEGFIDINLNTDGASLVKGDKIFFKLSFVTSSTHVFTASFYTPGELKNDLTSNVFGDYVIANGSSAISFIQSAITSSTGTTDTLVFNKELSAFENYTFIPYIPNVTTQDQFQLYNKLGLIDGVFYPNIGDSIVISWKNGTSYQSSEFDISNTFYSGSNKCISLNGSLPSSLISSINGGDTSSAGVDEFILLRKSKDETNLLLSFDKEPGETSFGFIIPENLHPDVLANIDVITKEVKQKLIENSNSGGSGTF